MAWTIRWRIVASFGIVLVTMVIMGTVTYMGLARIRAEAITATNDSIAGLLHSATARSALLATFVAAEQFALQHDVTSPSARSSTAATIWARSPKASTA